MKTLSLKAASQAALVCGLILVGCSTSPQGRKQITAPAPVSKAYSEADLRIKLATASTLAAPCVGVECTRNQEFDSQVQDLGSRLALAAFDNYPDLIQRVSAFEFEVSEKSEPGTTSNAAGKIIVYRGVQELGLDEAGLAFLLAREMGHVIGRHHDENSATRILLSVAAGVLFPALHLFNGTAIAQQATQATQATSAFTLSSAAASTAVSYVGSQAILAGLKPDQLSEADLVALGLLEKEGWHLHDVAGVLTLAEDLKAGGAWTEDLRVSIAHLQALDTAEQSIDLGSQAGAIVLSVERECRAEPDEAIPEPVGDEPVMAKEVAPEPVAEEPPPVVVAALPEAIKTVEAPALAPAVEESRPVPVAKMTSDVKRGNTVTKKMRLVKKTANGKPARPLAGKKAVPGKSAKTPVRTISKAVKSKAGNKSKPLAKSKPSRR